MPISSFQCFTREFKGQTGQRNVRHDAQEFNESPAGQSLSQSQQSSGKKPPTSFFELFFLRLQSFLLSKTWLQPLFNLKMSSVCVSLLWSGVVPLPRCVSDADGSADPRGVVWRHHQGSL